VTERGYGKRTEIDEYRLQTRGGIGVIDIFTSERNGPVVGFSYVQEGDELLVISQQGMIIRMQTNGVRVIGRNTQGVRLIDVQAEQRSRGPRRLVAKLVEKEDDEKIARQRGRATASDRSVIRESALAVLALVALSACSGAREHALLDQFFSASRLRDLTALQNVATVVFEPREQGRSWHSISHRLNVAATLRK